MCTYVYVYVMHGCSLFLLLLLSWLQVMSGKEKYNEYSLTKQRIRKKKKKERKRKRKKKRKEKKRKEKSEETGSKQERVKQTGK